MNDAPNQKMVSPFALRQVHSMETAVTVPVTESPFVTAASCQSRISGHHPRELNSTTSMTLQQNKENASFVAIANCLSTKNEMPDHSILSSSPSNTSAKENSCSSQLTTSAESTPAPSRKRRSRRKTTPMKHTPSPIQAEKQPVEEEKQPVEEEKQPAKTKRQSAKAKRQSAKAEKQPIEAEKQPIEAEKQSIEAEKQPAMAEKQPAKKEDDGKQVKQPPHEVLVSPTKQKQSTRGVKKRRAPVKRATASLPRLVVDVKFDRTVKGKPCLVVNKYKYTISRAGEAGRLFWRCSKRTCRATAGTIAEEMKVKLRHNHDRPRFKEFFGDARFDTPGKQVLAIINDDETDDEEELAINSETTCDELSEEMTSSQLAPMSSSTPDPDHKVTSTPRSMMSPPTPVTPLAGPSTVPTLFAQHSPTAQQQGIQALQNNVATWLHQGETELANGASNMSEAHTPETLKSCYEQMQQEFLKWMHAMPFHNAMLMQGAGSVPAQIQMLALLNRKSELTQLFFGTLVNLGSDNIHEREMAISAGMQTLAQIVQNDHAIYAAILSQCFGNGAHFGTGRI